MINEESIKLKNIQWIECDDFIAQQLEESNCYHYSSYPFKRIILKNIPHRRQKFGYRDDKMLILKVALHKPLISVHPAYALHLRIHHNNKLQHPNEFEKEKQDLQHWKIYDNIFAQLSRDGAFNKRRVDAALKILWPLAHWISECNLSREVKLVQ